MKRTREELKKEVMDLNAECDELILDYRDLYGRYMEMKKAFKKLKKEHDETLKVVAEQETRRCQEESTPFLNLCHVCGIAMGEGNPRQLCGKTQCENS